MACLISVAAVVLLAGCAFYGANPVTPTKAMVTGTWVHNGGAVLK
jgi:hypothetical protein